MITVGLAELCIIGVVVIVGLLIWNYVVVSRQEARGDGVRKVIEIDWSAMRDPQVQDFMTNNQQIKAIKRYRELTGFGLKEAKDAIDYVMANPNATPEKKNKAIYDTPDAGVRDLVRDGHIERAVEVYRVFAGVDEYTARDAVKEIERELRLDDDYSSHQDQTSAPDESHIRDLLRQGNKIEAIKVYRAMTGLGLKEAKDAVEAMERGQMR